MPATLQPPNLPISKNAIVLAAGRGARLAPHTDTTPKPLLRVRGKRLIEWQLEALARAGITQVVINTGWLWQQFEPALGNGDRYGLNIKYSHEGRDFAEQLAQRGQVALETAGGIARALPLLAQTADDLFWVLAGDSFMPENRTFEQNWRGVIGIAQFDAMDFDAMGFDAFINLVPNPAHHPGGDFNLLPSGEVRNAGTAGERLTYASSGLFRARMFNAIAWGNSQGTSQPMNTLLRKAADAGKLRGNKYEGPWADIGTPQALELANR